MQIKAVVPRPSRELGPHVVLSRAHIAHALAGYVKVSVAASHIDAQLVATQSDLDDIPHRPARGTKTVATKGHTKSTTVGDHGPARDKLVHGRETAETAIANLRIEKAKVDGERKAVEADLGPVRYRATLVGTADETAMRYFTLVLALLLDPAAVASRGNA